jgi:hypothetical protein
MSETAKPPRGSTNDGLALSPQNDAVVLVVTASLGSSDPVKTSSSPSRPYRRPATASLVVEAAVQGGAARDVRVGQGHASARMFTVPVTDDTKKRFLFAPYVGDTTKRHVLFRFRLLARESRSIKQQNRRHRGNGRLCLAASGGEARRAPPSMLTRMVRSRCLHSIAKAVRYFGLAVKLRNLLDSAARLRLGRVLQ